MSNTIKIKKSDSAGATPNTLEHGELAINYQDGKLFYKDSSNAIKNIAETKAYFSDTAPTNPVLGNLWYRTTSGRTYIYYDSTWVEIGSGAVGPTGVAIQSTEPASTDLLWVDTSEEGSPVLPPEGETGQVLVKSSSSDYDTSWSNIWENDQVILASQIFG
jgi:hypothetical protein